MIQIKQSEMENPRLDMHPVTRCRKKDRTSNLTMQNARMKNAKMKTCRRRFIRASKHTCFTEISAESLLHFKMLLLYNTNGSKKDVLQVMQEVRILNSQSVNR